MCTDHPAALDSLPTSRRRLLAGAGLAAAALTLGQGQRTTAAPAPRAPAPLPPPQSILPGLAIYPRSAWGADLPPKGPIAWEDPRFLLIHHTEMPNNYANARDVIRSIYAWHTGPAKRWVDVCYQFFVGRDGDVWEGRAHSAGGPTVADATGGSQGFGQLVCLLGSFNDVAPTPAAIDGLVKVLAWLGPRYGIDTTPGATTSFVSRGSNKWKAGVTITTPTIAGHRDMTYTDCPGNVLYALIPEIRERVAAQVEAWRGVLKPAQRLNNPHAP